MSSQFPKPSMGNGRKTATFLPPGRLAKERVNISKKPRLEGSSIGSEGIALVGKSTYGTNVLQVENHHARHISNPIGIDGFSAHSLMLHFGDDKLEEKVFTEECSFLDILEMCENFIDIYSIGVKITYGDGVQLKNDSDLLNMFTEHEHVEN